MGINLTSVNTSTSATLITDTVTVNGAPDTIPTLSKTAGGETVHAALEINSTKGMFLMPRMTTLKREALIVVPGSQVYDTDLDAVMIYFENGWFALQLAGSAGAILYKEVVIPSTRIPTLSSVPYLFLGAPGAGLMYHIHQLRLFALPSTVAWSLSPAFAFTYGLQLDPTRNPAAFQADAVLRGPGVEVSTAMSSSLITYSQVEPPLYSDRVAISAVNNAPIYMVGSIDTTTGNGGLKVSLWYSILECLE